MWRAAILAAGTGLAPVAVDAGPVCDTVDALAPFAMIGREGVRARVSSPLPATYCAFGLWYKGPLCAPKATLNGVIFERFDLDRVEVVATQATGTAIALKDSARYECHDNDIHDDIITGGGLVKGEPEPPYPFTIDTSGTNPLVSSCAQAFVDAVDRSNAIRAMPAVLELGDVHVARGEYGTIEVPPGGGVVRLQSLTLQGIRSRVQYGYTYECLYSGEDGAYLEVVSDYEDEVILDVVGKVSIGACGAISPWAEDFLINVAGQGKAVRMGKHAYGEGTSISILAPERTIKLEGTRVPEATYVGYIWGRKVVTRGYVEMDRPPCLP
jgi:hypothetical protein